MLADGAAASSTNRASLRRLRLILTALILAVALTPLCLGMTFAWGVTHPYCNSGPAPSALGLPFEDIVLVSSDGLRVPAYFIPGTTRAAVIIPPAFNSGRGSELQYAAILHRAGFNVVTLDSRVCTERGWISLGYLEVADVEAAYRYLQTRPEVDPSRVGAQGFSSAGATAIMAAARVPEIRAVVAMGGYHDYAAELGLGTLDDLVLSVFRVGVMFGYVLVTGHDLRVLSPYDDLPRLGKRPLLLVYGDQEVTLSGARRMLERARALGVPAELWIVPGASHGTYLGVASDEFAVRISAFFQSALLDGPAVYDFIPASS